MSQTPPTPSPPLRRPALAAAAVVSVIAACVIALPAHAHYDNWMYVWADQPTTAWYQPSIYYAHNSMNGVIWIERDGVGVYRVHFSGADLADFAEDGEGRQVTGYGTDGQYCDVDQQLFPVTVHCFDVTGSPVDTEFTLILVGKHDSGTSNPYVTVAAMQPSNPAYVPAEPRTNADLVTRTGVGTYQVDFDSFDAGGAGPRNAQVTVERTNTAGTGHHCNVQSWGDLFVNVKCFDASGSPADTAFYAHLQRERSDAPTVAFAWANLESNASYTPSSLYSSNPGGGTITATRSGTGVYSMHFDGFASIGEGLGHVQVSAYGQNDRRCSVTAWSADTVWLRCFDAAGNPADTQYSLLFRKRHSTLMTQGFAAAYVSNPSVSHTIDPADAWNPRGIGTARGPVEFTRAGVGEYFVTFTGFGVEGADQGVALATSSWQSRDCKIGGWTGETVSVRCFDGNGAFDDASFNVVFLRPEADNETIGYVWKANASAAVEIANPAYAHNPSGGQITTTRLGTGLYRVTFTGISAYGRNEGVPIVTAYGVSNDRCQLVFWSGDDVDVQCVSVTGAATDSTFVLAWFKPDVGTDGIAAALADLPAEPAYVALASKSHHPLDSAAALFRDDPGVYELSFGTLRVMGFEKYALVSTVGASAVRCDANIDFSSLRTFCRNPAGTFTDTAYAGVILAPIRLPEPGQAAQLAAGLVSLIWLARTRRAAATPRR